MLSKEDREELEALAQINDCLKAPSFMSRKNWRGQYQRLVQRGLVKWGPPPGEFDPRDFAGTQITDAGRAALSGTGVRHGAKSA